MLNNKITYNDTKIFSVKIRVTFKLLQTSLFLVQKIGQQTTFAVCFQIKLINRVGILTFQTVSTGWFLVTGFGPMIAATHTSNRQDILQKWNTYLFNKFITTIRLKAKSQFLERETPICGTDLPLPANNLF